ncbi:hypothetical protein ACWD1Y_04500 [Streptomyces sp. NPDC002814]
MHHTGREIQLAQALVEAADTFTDAFEALRQYARRRRLPIDRVANAVIERVADDAELRGEGGESGGTVGGPA